MEPRRLTLVADALEAEMVCGLLREEGIRCAHRITDHAFGAGGEVASAGAGTREVLVSDAQLDAARDLLTRASASDPTSDSGEHES